jgi:hypothetical protein
MPAPLKDAIVAACQNRTPVSIADLLSDLLVPAPIVKRAESRLFSGAFNKNASDPGAGHNYGHFDALDLWNKGSQNNSSLSANEARAFVDGCLRSRFANEKRIGDARAKNGLAALDTETLINLYEKIASEDTPERSIYLRELNRALNPGDAFYEQRVTRVRHFFGRGNTPMIEQRWAEAKRTGRIPKTEGNFADTMADLMAHPPLLSRQEYLRRLSILQFICDTYSESIGETSVPVKLFQGQPGMKGFQVGKDGPQGEMIGINLIEMHDFRSALNVLMHERQHVTQDRLSDAYSKGKIQKTDPDYLAARLFTANRNDHGYLTPDSPGGPEAYLYQPMEVDAHNAGNTAEYHATRTYAKPPKPHTGAAPNLRAA